jgi:hypothetical protein
MRQRRLPRGAGPRLFGKPQRSAFATGIFRMTATGAGLKLSWHPTIVKIKKVNSSGFHFFHAVNCVIFCVFTRKNAILKVR